MLKIMYMGKDEIERDGGCGYEKFALDGLLCTRIDCVYRQSRLYFACDYSLFVLEINLNDPQSRL